MIAAAGYQHIRMYEINSSNPNPIVNYEGISRNVTTVGFHEDGHWMYTGGEDCSARVWDLRNYYHRLGLMNINKVGFSFQIKKSTVPEDISSVCSC